MKLGGFANPLKKKYSKKNIVNKKKIVQCIVYRTSILYKIQAIVHITIISIGIGLFERRWIQSTLESALTSNDDQSISPFHRSPQRYIACCHSFLSSPSYFLFLPMICSMIIMSRFTAVY